MLVTLNEILTKAKAEGYAVPATNVDHDHNVRAAIEAAEEMNSPLILNMTPTANPDMEFFGPIAAEMARRSSQQICLNLDHGKTFEQCLLGVRSGFTNIMIDRSTLPFEENVKQVKEMVDICHALGLTVEGELGVLAGVEDHVFAANSTYTNPLSAIEFFRKTKVDALAISYGTMHGANKGKNAVIRKEIAIAIKECMRHEGMEGYLVSHGSSTVPRYIVDEINALGGEITNAYGIDANQLIEAGHCGINKINVDTDIRLAVTRNMKELFARDAALRNSASVGAIYELLEKNKSAFDPRVFITPIMDTVMYGNVPDEDVARICQCIEDGVKEVVGTLIVKFGSYGKAPKVELATLDEMAERYKKAGI